MSKSLIIYFSRADENYSVGYISKGNTEYIAEFVQELTGADMIKVEPEVPKRLITRLVLRRQRSVSEMLRSKRNLRIFPVTIPFSL